MTTSKEINRKNYNFQGLSLQMKVRNFEVRKNTSLFLNDFLEYAKDFTQDKLGLSIATMTYFSDEDKLRQLFSLTLDGDVDKINYTLEENEKYMALINFAGELFTDFFSYILPQQVKTVKKSKN